MRATAGACPALTALRHDRNSIVGMTDISATMMKIESFPRKAWLWKIIGRALLEIEDAHQPDREQDGRRSAQHRIGDLQLAGAGKRQLAADQDELDRKRRHQRERRNVMEKGEQRSHLFVSFWHALAGDELAGPEYPTRAHFPCVRTG